MARKEKLDLRAEPALREILDLPVLMVPLVLMVLMVIVVPSEILVLRVSLNSQTHFIAQYLQKISCIRYG